MKRKKILKIIAIVLFILFCVKLCDFQVNAMTSNYAANDNKTDVDLKVNSVLGAISDIILPIIYPIFAALAKLTQKVIHAFTGKFMFPWADMIIFNRLPFLDVNFINPEPGSLFMNSGGEMTKLGLTVRSIYFSALSICIGFFGICVAVNVIKMLLATLPSAKARYKEMISATLMSLILIFGMHYVISFVFYMNEQLVQVASGMSEKILSGETISKAADGLQIAEDKDNDKLLENFFEKCNKTSWWSPVTIVKKLVKEGVNKVVEWCSNLAGDIKKAWDSFWGKDNEDETITFDEKEKKDNGYYGKVFPSKEDFIGYFNDESKVGKHGKDIAAYLLKDYIYRDSVLSMVAGNDTNKFTNAGLWGWGQSALNTVLWVTGVVDTGLQGLQNLYNSVCYINKELKDQEGVDFSSASACQKTIENFTIQENKETDDVKITAAHIKTLYCKAYYRYIYEGEDKEIIEGNTSPVQNLGEYFKRNIYYTDVESGQWSPSTFDAITCILYCVFVLQSFMFLFSYIKRLLYVVILALLGPVTVLFDYVKKSY